MQLAFFQLFYKLLTSLSLYDQSNYVEAWINGMYVRNIWYNRIIWCLYWCINRCSLETSFLPGTTVIGVGTWILNDPLVEQVLITKLRSATNPETQQSRKAAKALVVLMPLLGVVYVFILTGPRKLPSYEHLRALLISTQVIACLRTMKWDLNSRQLSLFPRLLSPLNHHSPVNSHTCSSKIKLLLVKSAWDHAFFCFTI
jgi:hypothetical protein